MLIQFFYKYYILVEKTLFLGLILFNIEIQLSVLSFVNACAKAETQFSEWMCFTSSGEHLLKYILDSERKSNWQPAASISKISLTVPCKQDRKWTPNRKDFKVCQLYVKNFLIILFLLLRDIYIFSKFEIFYIWA